MTDIRKDSILESLRNSHLVKVLLIGGLILLLQIPIFKIRGIIKEREQTREQAVSEVAGKWGASQSLIGPTIIVPYVNRSLPGSNRGQQRPGAAVEYATFLPESLKISGIVKSEPRYRGIFEIPVYRMSLALSGHFSRPDFSEWDVDTNDILWDRAYLCLRISDAQAMTKAPVLSWNNQPLGFLPSAGELAGT